MSPAGPDSLRLEARHHPHPLDYVQHLAYRYQSQLLLHDVMQTAMIVEPQDRTLEPDLQVRRAKAFFTGFVLGFRVADKFLPKDFFRYMRSTQSVDPSDDTPHGVHEAAAGIMESGARGYADAKPYHDLFEDWEDQLCPEVDTQPYLKPGFGLLVSMMRVAEAEHGLESMAQLLDNAPPDGLNWDNEFKKLMDNGDFSD